MSDDSMTTLLLVEVHSRDDVEWVVKPTSQKIAAEVEALLHEFGPRHGPHIYGSVQPWGDLPVAEAEPDKWGFTNEVHDTVVEAIARNPERVQQLLDLASGRRTVLGPGKEGG